MGKITVWTRQDEKVLEEIEASGSYRVKRQSIVKKYGDCSAVYLHVYEWFSEEASKRVARPDGVTYPVWLATGEKFKLNPVEGQVLLELEIDSSNLIIVDEAKWDYILNYWYIPKDEADGKRYNEELKRQGIHNETKMYMEDFHPILKRAVRASWDRLFENKIPLAAVNQVTVWEIKREWVKKVIRA